MFFNDELLSQNHAGGLSTQTARFMCPTWGPPGSCRPKVGPMLAPRALLSWKLSTRAQTNNVILLDFLIGKGRCEVLSIPFWDVYCGPRTRLVAGWGTHPSKINSILHIYLSSMSQGYYLMLLKWRWNHSSKQPWQRIIQSKWFQIHRFSFDEICYPSPTIMTLHECHSVSNHPQLDCLFNRFFRLTTEKRQISTSLALYKVNLLVISHKASKGKAFLQYWAGICHWWLFFHYDDVIMGAMASQITSLTIVYSTVYSDADQGKHQCPVSLAFVRGIHRGPVNSPHKWPVTRKMLDDVIIRSSRLRCAQVKYWKLLAWCGLAMAV